MIKEVVTESDRRGIVAIVGEVDPVQPSPVDGAETHWAGFATGVDFAAGQIECLQCLTGEPDRHYLGVRSRIKVGGNLVEAFGDDLSCLNNHRTERTAFAGSHH